ncbi:MAG TPA: hypothetical protein VGI56_11320 [Galbitalea sp.]
MERQPYADAIAVGLSGIADVETSISVPSVVRSSARGIADSMVVVPAR